MPETRLRRRTLGRFHRNIGVLTARPSRSRSLQGRTRSPSTSELSQSSSGFLARPAEVWRREPSPLVAPSGPSKRGAARKGGHCQRPQPTSWVVAPLYQRLLFGDDYIFFFCGRSGTTASFALGGPPIRIVVSRALLCR